MKSIQGKNIVGHVTIQIEGDYPEYFFQICSDHRIPVWDIKKIDHTHCVGKIYYYDLKKVRKLVHHGNYELSVIERKGYINHFIHLWKRKEILFAILLSCLFIVILSNIAWKIEINGVPTELEEKISTQLKENGLYEGAWTFTLAPLNILQQDISEEIPELLYIGIEKKGTTYVVQAEEKLIVPEEEKKQAQHLIANKSGIIQKMFIKNGQALVRVNDYVEKGEILVSGIIDNSAEDQEDDEESGVNQEIVTAEGEVYANTWYEVDVTSSLYQTHEKLSGEQVTKYFLQIFNFDLPVWGFGKIPYDHVFEETEKQPVHILKWEIPIPIIKKTIYNQEIFSQIRTEADAREIGIQHALEDLQIRLGQDSNILKYYVLHESVENGKVKLNLYISVLEDIASSRSIH